MPGVDVGLEGVGDAGESLGGKADRLGISYGSSLPEGRRPRGQKAETETEDEAECDPVAPCRGPVWAGDGIKHGLKMRPSQAPPQAAGILERSDFEVALPSVSSLRSLRWSQLDLSGVASMSYSTNTHNPLAIDQPMTLTVLKAGALVAAVSVLVLFSVRLSDPLLTPSAWPWLATGFLVGYLLADLLSGTVHWFCDSFFAPDTPLIGRTIIHPFRDHHDHPDAITQYGFLEQDSTSYIIIIPPLLLALRAGGPDVTSPAAVFIHGLLFAFAVGALGTIPLPQVGACPACPQRGPLAPKAWSHPVP